MDKLVDPEIKINKEIKFPIDETLNFLNPFHTTTSDPSVPNKFIYLEGGNPIYKKCITPAENIFIIDLIDKLLLSKKNDTRFKYRYNINVIRPLRDEQLFLEAQPPLTGNWGGTVSRAATSTPNIKELRNPLNGGTKKAMLDATLIKTLEGFCEISNADTKTNAN
jgi:hypothetical protein